MKKSSRLLTFYTVLIFIILYLPIGVMILFSFNEPRGNLKHLWTSSDGP